LETRSKPRFSLYLITDRKLAEAHGGLLAQVEAALSAASTCAPPGAVALQLREKDLDARPLHELARALNERCLRFSVPLLINDRLDVAIAVGAAGVHLPTNSFNVLDARQLLGPSALIGVSTHKPSEAAAAARAGADFAVFGPIFDPLSKSAYGPAHGGAPLRAACAAADTMPVYALGGITVERVRELRAVSSVSEAHRPAGVGVIGAVFGTDDSHTTTRALLHALAEW
jgi:thiamine-phosphate pyrophosphorylase